MRDLATSDGDFTKKMVELGVIAKCKFVSECTSVNLYPDLAYRT